jgi:hypothetical protein
MKKCITLYSINLYNQLKYTTYLFRECTGGPQTVCEPLTFRREQWRRQGWKVVKAPSDHTSDFGETKGRSPHT